ncbi:MBL fold metallo-hydrolase [Marivita sp. XM-24bin2]|jgi:glyoxylase-like metal-dependent hydrolase (beta-lactamase superfamily II)|uniref:MBL fold metallo-hydrolase n=1 Tax=unclassified Marivita TaxID=2632480 RepID=UPI000D7ACB57|nr:MBL fold metallo-hydrolase [Marivita sp. XM-24bin2]MCR9109862.1 MBL fold metallo-hydrolase [Paracoccaceae bacterium]PWL36443.1 MAG: MBL fold metallo-hydrolase [Marivita sp. XM-24bin2]
MKLSRTSASKGAGSAEVTGFYDADTGSIQYLVSDPETRKAALIDTVLSFDHKSASTCTDSVDAILRYAETEGLEIDWILDTHPHADHLMASSYLKDRVGKPNAIGEKIKDIAVLWRDYYNLPDAFEPERDFDHLFADGDTFQIGELPVRVMLSPGHTLGSISYIVGNDAAFAHDTFMQPDAGTSRADFPGGTTDDLWNSLQALLALPDDTRLFIGHDYGTEHRPGPEWESTVAEQRRHNIHLGGGASRESYVEQREARDKTLALPDRMLHVLQMNLRAGRAPDPEPDGHSYLKIPLNRF